MTDPLSAIADGAAGPAADSRALADRSRIRHVTVLLLATFAVGCSGGARSSAPGERLGVDRSEIVYGSDDRHEVFQTEDTAVRMRVSWSVVALVPKDAIVRKEGGVTIDAPSLGEVEGLCREEPFFAQPAAALCSAVLVDWDLVLTAGHCVHAIPLQDLAVEFGYYYDSPGRLALVDEDVIDADAVVAEALDVAGAEPRLDYAVIRLSRPVGASREPAAIRESAVASGSKVVFAGAGGGVPLKIDTGGSVQDAHAPSFDFFTADTDTSRGASGGPAFDEDLALLGILARGGPDLIATDAGCNAAIHEPDGAGAQEEFTYAYRAMERLCDHDPKRSLCRSGCGDPCSALPRRAAFGSGGGCSVTGVLRPARTNSLPLLVLAGLAGSRFARGRSRRLPPRAAVAVSVS